MSIETEKIKEHAKNVDTWVRGLFIILFGIIFYFLYLIIGLLVIFQFFTKVLTGGLNENLLDFSAGMTRYVEQILRYITFHAEERPFPFSPWPAAGGGSEAEPGGPGESGE